MGKECGGRAAGEGLWWGAWSRSEDGWCQYLIHTKHSWDQRGEISTNPHIGRPVLPYSIPGFSHGGGSTHTLAPRHPGAGRWHWQMQPRLHSRHPVSPVITLRPGRKMTRCWATRAKSWMNSSLRWVRAAPAAWGVLAPTGAGAGVGAGGAAAVAAARAGPRNGLGRPNRECLLPGPCGPQSAQGREACRRSGEAARTASARCSSVVLPTMKLGACQGDHQGEGEGSFSSC